MKWTKIILETTTEAEDLVSAVLSEMGIEGIEIEDKVQLSEKDKKRMFIDILPELPPDDGVAEISFYCDTETDVSELMADVLENLSVYSEEYNLGTLRYEISETEDKDWINNWKEFFHPFRIDDTIVIKPTWTELEEAKPGDMVIEIDPGTAFGTGAHETTKLCILNLKKYLKNNDRLLDVGCGSGILSIMGMKLGAYGALGIDVDDNASRTSVENAHVNDIESGYLDEAFIAGVKNGASDGNPDSVDGCAKLAIKENYISFFTGNVLEDEALCRSIGFDRFEVVVANILADIIIPLSAVCAKYMRRDALFISSGIINTKEEAVKQALLDNAFEIVEISHMNDWVSIVARKK